MDNLVEISYLQGCDKSLYDCSFLDGLQESWNKLTDVSPLLTMSNIVVDDGSKKSLLFFNPEYSNTICIKSSFDKFVLFIMKNVVSTKNEISQTYGLVKMAMNLGVEQNTLSQLFVMNNWGSFEKGMKYINAIDNSSQALKKLLFDGKVSLQIAYLFADFFCDCQYDVLLNVLPEMSFSENTKILQYIVEIAKNSNDNEKTLLELTKKIEGQDRKKVVEIIYQCRYPQRNSLEKQFENFLSEIKLKNRVVAPFPFEKQTYTLNVHFSDAQDLSKQLENISKKLNQLDKTQDMFVLDNIFKKSNQDEK